MSEQEGRKITLTDEEGGLHEFRLWKAVELDEKRYALLMPEGEPETVYVFRLEAEERLVPVEDDEELALIAAAVGDIEFNEADDS